MREKSETVVRIEIRGPIEKEPGRGGRFVLPIWYLTAEGGRHTGRRSYRLRRDAVAEAARIEACPDVPAGRVTINTYPPNQPGGDPILIVTETFGRSVPL